MLERIRTTIKKTIMTVAIVCAALYGWTEPAPSEISGLVVGIGVDEKWAADVRSRPAVLVDVLAEVGDTLPYVDNLVNLLVVAEGRPAPPKEEILRVLRPGGRARIDGETIEKPWPSEYDDWTHYLHGPDNNAVSRDRAVDVLRRLQWAAGPRVGRHHDHMSSISACVAAGGRVFYIIDEGLRASIYLPPHWKLIARDAFNGVLLWKQPIAEWHTHLQGLKSGPPGLPHRLVAVGDRVYVTLGIKAPVSELDTATGRMLRAYEGTEGAEQIRIQDDMLFAATQKEVMAFKTDGTALWRQSAPGVMIGTFAIAGDRVFYFDGEKVHALDAATGREHWQSEPLAALDRNAKAGGFAPTLVVANDTVLFSGGDSLLPSDMGHDGTLTALDAATGRKRWQGPHPPSGYKSPEDVLAIDGLIWCGNTTHHGVGSPWEKKDPDGTKRGSTGLFTGRDARTGEVKKTIVMPDDYFWFHHRCHPGKATERFLLMSRTGIEFLDMESGETTMHHWARGACLYGIMPANGMVYAPQHPCACYLMSKISGFCALAPAGQRAAPKPAARLEKGPAYAAPAATQNAAAGDWPMYRRDIERSGFSPEPIGDALAPIWKQKLEGAVSAPILADGKLYVALKDCPVVRALDASNGRPIWSFEAGGPVDSPPVFAGGRIVFGCSDGRVYTLDASTGRLVWRYLAAPNERRHVYYDQVESTHPVSGSVLAIGDRVYAVSGRYRFLDGGMRFVVLDLTTGQPIAETLLDDKDPATGQPFQANHDMLNMPTATPDILVSDGKTIWMKDQAFDLDGRMGPVRVSGQFGDYNKEPRHLLCPTGLLDDDFWHRSYWVYGTTFASGYAGYPGAGRLFPAGRMLVFNDDTVFGYGRRAEMYRWSSPMEYTLFAANKDAPTVTKGEGRKRMMRFERQWELQDFPLQVRALALAGDRLLVLGVRDVLDETRARNNPEGWAEQEEHMIGCHGSVLQIVDAKTGEKMSERELDLFPTFDGMIAAGGRVYITGADGAVWCLEKDKENRTDGE